MTGFYQELCHQTMAAQKMLSEIPVIRQAMTGDITLNQYQKFLEQAYHHVKHTVPLLMACGSRIGNQYPWLQSAIAEYIEEELGHEEWILSDIRYTGGDAEAVRTGAPAHPTEMMVAYAYHQIDRGNPIGFFGMVHVLEGTSVALATQAAGAIQLSLDLPDQAFSYLRSHGSLDQEHVVFFENLMNRVMNHGDQREILHCAGRFYQLYGDIFRSLSVNQEEIEYAE
jgi:thiaminase